MRNTSLLSITRILVFVSTLASTYVWSQSYFPEPESKGGWRKNTSAGFVEQLGFDYERLQYWSYWNQWLPSDHYRTSVILIRDGWILNEAYVYPEVQHTRIDLASVGKSVALALFGSVLEESASGNIESELSLKSKLYDLEWLPQGFPLSDPKKSEIRFSHVLEHTSGLCPELGGVGYFFEHGRHKWADYEDWVVGHDLRWKRNQQVYFTPGHSEEFNGDPYWKGYSSVGFAHIGLVISNLYNLPASQILESKILNPIGIKDIEYPNPPSSTIKWFSAGGLAVTPRDFARLAYLFLNNGRWDKKQIVPEAWMKEILGSGKYPNFMTNHNNELGSRYPKDMFRIYGAGGNFAYIIPTMNLVALHTDNTRPEVQLEIEAQFLSLLFDAMIE